MNVVIDSNILFSALIKDALTRKMILEYDGLFLFPPFIIEEMKKHKQELVKKSGMKKEEFEQLLGILLKKVVVVPEEIILPFRKKAEELVKGIDHDDAIFVASVLAHQGSILWSDDKHLKKISKIMVKNTSEMIKYLLK